MRDQPKYGVFTPVCIVPRRKLNDFVVNGVALAVSTFRFRSDDHRHWVYTSHVLARGKILSLYADLVSKDRESWGRLQSPTAPITTRRFYGLRIGADRVTLPHPFCERSLSTLYTNWSIRSTGNSFHTSTDSIVVRGNLMLFQLYTVADSRWLRVPCNFQRYSYITLRHLWNVMSTYHSLNLSNRLSHRRMI